MAQATVPSSRSAIFRRLLPLYLGILVGPMNTSGAFNLVPVFSDSFDVSLALAGLAITLYMLPFVASQVLSGSLAEMLGPNRALLLGFVIFAGSCLLAAIAPSYPAFLAARMLQGVGGGVILPVGMAMAASQVPANRTGTAVGGIQAAFAAGLAVGPGVAGVFAEQTGWRGFFFFLAGAGLLAATAIAVAYSLRYLGGPDRRNPLRPLRQAVAIPGVRALSLIGFMLLFSSVGVSIFIAVWLQTTGLAGPAGAGLLLAVPGLVGIVAAPVAGYLGDRWGVPRAVLAGIGLSMAGVLGLFVAPEALLLYPAFLLLTGMGNVSTTTNLGAMSLVLWPQVRQAVAGVVSGSRFLGVALAPVLLTYVYQAASFRGVLAVAVGAMLLASLMLRLVREERPAGAGQRTT